MASAFKAIRNGRLIDLPSRQSVAADILIEDDTIRGSASLEWMRPRTRNTWTRPTAR